MCRYFASLSTSAPKMSKIPSSTAKRMARYETVELKYTPGISCNGTSMWREETDCCNWKLPHRKLGHAREDLPSREAQDRRRTRRWARKAVAGEESPSKKQPHVSNDPLSTLIDNTAGSKVRRVHIHNGPHHLETPTFIVTEGLWCQRWRAIRADLRK